VREENRKLASQLETMKRIMITFDHEHLEQKSEDEVI